MSHFLSQAFIGRKYLKKGDTSFKVRRVIHIKV